MARKSRKQTAAPMPAPSLYVHVALYIRLSVEDNKKRGCSVENQKLVLNDFLSDKPDFVVYDTYIDNGATGTNFHRPGFQQMLSDIEAGHINCVIVKDLSRLGRNSIDTGYYIEQYFHAHNVRFIAVTDQFDTADSGNLHGGIMLPLKNMINEAYALDIGRKIKAQARQAMKDGDYIGARAPYGYRKDPDNCHKLLIDENTAPVVKQIFEWAHEHVSLNRIVRNLNEMGIPAPSHYKKATGEITSPGLIGSGKWQTRTVMKILESEVYTGDLVQGKTKIVDHQQVKAGEDNLIIAKCTHEPIISHELFHAVQEYRKQICEESKATPKRPYTPNIFKGKVFCADCGRSLHRQRAERRKGPDTYWFHCLTNSRVEKDSCKGATMQEKELISTVTAILEKELTVALGMSLPLFQLEARQKQEKDKLKIQMSAKRQEIEKTRRLIRGLYENFVQGILTNDEYFELKADYEHAINALSGEIEVFEKSMDSLDNQLARYRAMEKDAKTLAQDHVLTAELIERLIERIEIDHERNIHVTFRFKNEFQGKAVESCKTESLSIPNQKLILREKAMSLPEWDNSEILEFIDNGHTGTNFERPAVQELLTMVQAGKINCIIVKDLSRFGRNSIETGYFIERVFPLYHTRFISVSDDFDTANFKGDTGGIDIAFKYLISECYSRDMSMKTKSAKYAKMRRGEYQSVICPYGYRKSADGRMEPDEDVAPNVQMIFQWASEGNTAAEITRKLYAMNIPTPGEYRKLKGKDYYNVSRTNGVWSTSTVLRILEDQRYIGTYVIGKRKVKEIGSRHTQLKDESEWFKIPNHHPAIVSVDLFEKANASIKRFSLLNKKPRDYLLRGKVFCGCCDHAMSLRNGAWFYCRHSEVAETLSCHGVRIKMADLEQVVFETIRAQMCPALGIDSNKDKLDLQTVQQAEHEEKLRSIQDSKRHLYEQYALGEIDLETYRTRKAVYDTELVQAKNVHAVITAQTKQIKSDYEIKLKQQEIVQEVGNANMLTKALIDRLINKVYVFPGERIEIEYATQDFLETKESEKEV